MQNAPSPELRTQFKEQPIPGWQPYETDPQVRRIDSHGAEYSIPYYDILGRGQRYFNPFTPEHIHRGHHPTVRLIHGLEDNKLPRYQMVGLEGPGKSLIEMLAMGYSGYEEDYRRYILEKADMETHRFLLKQCAALENDVLACLDEEQACADVYAELLTCAAVRLFPEVTAELAAVPLEQVGEESFVGRKNELIRNTVSAFLRRDRYYTTRQMDFYRRRVQHCFDLDHVERMHQFNWQSNAYELPWLEFDSGFPSPVEPGASSFEDTTDMQADHPADARYAGVDALKNRDLRYGMYLQYGDDAAEELAREEEFDLAMAKCVVPAICPKPLDTWVMCVTAAEGNESHCWREHKRLLSCLYNFQFYAFNDDDPYSSISPYTSSDDDDDGDDPNDLVEENEGHGEFVSGTDLGPHTSLFRTGLYRIFHNDPNTIPLEELEEDHRMMRKQITRLEQIKQRARAGAF